MDSEIIDRGRGLEISGTRITVYDVWDYARHGWHETQIAVTLRLGSRQVRAALTYIEEHKDEVMSAYQEMVDRDARGNPPEIREKLQASREKLERFIQDRRERKVAPGMKTMGTERADP
jgi:uncharacterized protein (DUF433 family)